MSIPEYIQLYRAAKREKSRMVEPYLGDVFEPKVFVVSPHKPRRSLGEWCFQTGLPLFGIAVFAVILFMGLTFLMDGQFHYSSSYVR